jgi:hypothetical protein
MSRKKRHHPTRKLVLRVYPHEEAILRSVAKEPGKFVYEKWDKIVKKAREMHGRHGPKPKKKAIALDIKEAAYRELKELIKGRSTRNCGKRMPFSGPDLNKSATF